MTMTSATLIITKLGSVGEPVATKPFAEAARAAAELLTGSRAIAISCNDLQYPSALRRALISPQHGARLANLGAIWPRRLSKTQVASSGATKTRGDSSAAEEIRQIGRSLAARIGAQLASNALCALQDG